MIIFLVIIDIYWISESNDSENHLNGRRLSYLESNGRIVAIVDDQEGITELFCDALSTIDGITIFKLQIPYLRLNTLQLIETYILVISDFRMAGLNGMELLKKVKNMNPHARTLLMSAFEIDDKLLKDHINQQIIDGFPQKPVSLVYLRSEVNKQLHAYEMQKQESIVRNK
jgi:two-component system response regulator (stage 0 sporulation protein F)